MDDGWVLTITALSGLAGAAVGGAFTYLAAVTQHRRDLVAERQREDRQRVIAAAMQCDKLFRDAASAVQDLVRRGRDDEGQLWEQVSKACDEIEMLAMELPGKVGSRVAEAADLLYHCDELAESGFHYHGKWAIAGSVKREMHRLLVTVVRGEPPPPQTRIFDEYSVSFDELRDAREDELGFELHEEQIARDKWLDDHPNFRSEAKERPSPASGSSAVE